jgi:LPS-assembly protein
MKNKLLTLTTIYFVLIGFSFSQEFIFKTKKIEITESGKLIIATYGKAVSIDGDLEISADKFKYDKNKNILNVNGNGSILKKSQNLKIFFNDAIIDQNNSIIQANGNVKILNNENNLKIVSDSIFYNQNQNYIKSDTKTNIQDSYQNYYLVDRFFYEINKDLVKVENLLYRDFQNNELRTSIAYINTKTNRLFGKDISVDLNNKILENKNEPRLKGNSIINDDEYSKINKGIFTTCKKRDGCPPWQLSADKIQHDKKKKIIKYENAVLRIYDVPVMYFPKFFHPDPTVKRQSGFLIPSFNNSNNSSNYLNVPYFLAVAENKDFTFSPRFYSNNKFLFQTEYRQVGLRSDHIANFSFFKENNKNLNNHFFYKFDKILSFKNFEESQLDFKLQQTSDQTYIKKNKIDSELIDNENIMENSLNLSLYSNDFSIDIETTAYENLSKTQSDKYEFIFPKIDFVKKIPNKTSLNGDFSFSSENLVRNYNTNIFENSNINDLIFSSYPKISNLGFYNNYEFKIKNSNTYGKKSEIFKNKESSYVSGLLQLNSSLPLIRKNKNFQEILKPKLSFKMAPAHTKDYKKDETNIDITNLFSLNRINKNDTIEGGLSLAYGTDYLVLSQKDNRELLSFKAANNLRLNDNSDLTHSNQIGQKTSNFFTETLFNPNDFLNIKYKTAIKNNLSEISNESFITEFKIKNFTTSFDYLNENDTNQKKSYLANTSTYNLNNFNSLIFSTREDKTTNLTEFYKLIYQYKNDCLAASIEYNKDYYNDRDLKTEESIFFKLSIIPFGESSSPNLRK